MSRYWLRPKPSLRNICDRVVSILTGITPLPAQAGETDAPTRISQDNDAIASFPKRVIAINGFQFLKEALKYGDTRQLENPLLFDYSRVFVFIMRDGQDIKAPSRGDKLIRNQDAEGNYLIFICYPVDTQARGAYSAFALDELQRHIIDGFTGTCFGRSYYCYCEGSQPYNIDADWAVEEVRVKVPYRTGSMDNPQVRANRGHIVDQVIVTDPDANGGPAPNLGVDNPQRITESGAGDQSVRTTESGQIRTTEE